MDITQMLNWVPAFHSLHTAPNETVSDFYGTLVFCSIILIVVGMIFFVNISTDKKMGRANHESIRMQAARGTAFIVLGIGALFVFWYMVVVVAACLLLWFVWAFIHGIIVACRTARTTPQ